MTSVFFPQTIDLSASAVQLIRTALNNPKVTFDKTGLKAYDANGNKVFDLDAETGNASFTGLLTALALALTAGSNGSVTGDEITWERLSDGAAIVKVAGYQTVFIQGSTADVTDTLLLEAITGSGDTGSQILLKTIDSTGTQHIATLLDSSGQSNFLQLPTDTVLKAQVGSGTIASVPVGTTLQTVTLPTSWPTKHIAFICTAIPLSSDAAGNYVQGSTALNLSQGKLQIVNATVQNWAYEYVSFGY